MASMTSLNKEEEAAQAHQEAMEEAEATATDPSAAAAVAAARTISRRGEEARGGFVLRAKSDEYPSRRRSLVERTGMKTLVQGLKLKKQRSTGDLDRKGVTSIRSTGSSTSWMSSGSGFTTGASVMSEGSNQSFVCEDEQLDASVTETYMGEWKNDKRCGFGISERSDGLKYEGEWYNNRKYGYGITTHGGVREEGKYKNNVLVTSNQKRHLFLIRSAKFRERIDSAVNAAQRASKIALQKADIAISRTATARGKAEQADYAAVCANEDSSEARTCASNFAPEFKQPDGTLMTPGALLSESGAGIGPGARASAHGPPPALKLELPGTGRAGPGPPSPRGAMAGGGPGPPSASPQPNMANHVSVISKPQAPVPAPPSSLDVRSQNHAPPPAPAPAPKPMPIPTKAAAPPRNNPVSPPPSASDRPAPGPLLSAPPPRTEVPQASHPDPAVLRQPQSLQPVAQPEPRGRTPTRQERSRLSAQNDNGAAPAAGGYNFQKIMDDRFEHYKRPASRERSQDPGGRAASRGGMGAPSRDGSREAGMQRAGSRQRTPMEPSFSDIKPSGGLDGLGLEGHHASKNGTGNGAANGAGLDFKLPANGAGL